MTALGIDVGTSGVRCAVLDLSGAEIASAEAKMSEAGADPRDPAVWARTLESSLIRLAAIADLSAVQAMAVDGTSGTVLGLDAEGEPVGKALMYNDAVERRDILEQISAVAPRESAAHGASSALARACLLQERRGVARIVHQADWIAGILAGAPIPSDESNALKTGYDPVSRCWPEWLSDAPIHREFLPAVVPVGSKTGEACGRFGLPEGAVIVAGASDGCASFLATGAAMPGDGVSALGTTLTIKLLSNSPVFAPEYGIYSHRIGDIWLAGGASNTGGGALAAFFSPKQIAELSKLIDTAAESGFDYYPLPRPGERFPINNPGLEPRVEPRPVEDAAFLNGLLEGIARIEQLGYARLAELGAPELRTLRSVGGGSGNSAWTAIRRRIIDVPFKAARSTSAAAGIATLAVSHLAGSA